MSTRGTILNTLATKLLTITTANGFTQDILHVYREVHHPEESDAIGMDITILDNAGDAPLQYASGGIVRTSMSIVLIVDVWGDQLTEPTDGTHPLSIKVDNAIGDIRELIFAPIALGSDALFTEMGESESISIGQRRSRFTMPLQIHYKFDGASP